MAKSPGQKTGVGLTSVFFAGFLPFTGTPGRRESWII